MVEFAKMQGCGNDFILMHREDLRWPVSLFAKMVCDRKFGVGADGLLMLAPSQKATVRMVYYNSDGSPASFCGNGIRCFARYVRDQGFADSDQFTIESDAGIHKVRLISGGSVSVEIGKPQFESAEIPVLLPGKQVLNRDYHNKKISCVKIGVPHTIWFVKDCEEPDLVKEAKLFEQNPDFPDSTNFSAATILAPDALAVRTCERGAGLTLACGSGCCAAVAVGQQMGLLRPQVTVTTEGGRVQVKRDAEGVLWLTGPAQWICRGRLCGELLARMQEKG